MYLRKDIYKAKDKYKTNETDGQKDRLKRAMLKGQTERKGQTDKKTDRHKNTDRHTDKKKDIQKDIVYLSKSERHEVDVRHYVLHV